MIFEWDEAKRQANRHKHRIDFVIAARLFDGRPLWTIPSVRVDEERFLSCGILAGRFITVIWVRRADVIRLISARRSRHEETRAYRALFN